MNQNQAELAQALRELEDAQKSFAFADALASAPREPERLAAMWGAAFKRLGRASRRVAVLTR